MRLKPLEQWICDRCGEVIEKASDGMLQWFTEETLADGRDRDTGLAIVHHANASPFGRGREGLGCYHSEPHIKDVHLDTCVGPDGLMKVLSYLTTCEMVEASEITEIIRRLHVAGYEEARQYFDRAHRDGILRSDLRALGIVDTYQIERILDRYRDDDDEVE